MTDSDRWTKERRRERDAHAEKGREKKGESSRVAATGDRAALRRRIARLLTVKACWPLTR